MFLFSFRFVFCFVFVGLGGPGGGVGAPGGGLLPLLLRVLKPPPGAPKPPPGPPTPRKKQIKKQNNCLGRVPLSDPDETWWKLFLPVSRSFLNSSGTKIRGKHIKTTE